MGNSLPQPTLEQADSFPRTLGPFAIAQTKLQAGDFQLQETPTTERQTVYLIQKESLERHGLRCDADAKFPLMGQFSPAHAITLSAAEKVAFGIPAKASSFVWSYPVSGWTCLSDSHPIANFFALGGYAYFDSAGTMLRCNTLTCAPALAGDGLQFGKAQPWQKEWTASLVREGRFQPITIKGLYDAGARYFCWLRPGEMISGHSGEQPNVPHGGFVYLFHGDPAAHSPSDCYFAIVSGEEYQHRDLTSEASKDCSVPSWISFMNATQETFERISQDPHVKEDKTMPAAAPHVKEDTTMPAAAPHVQEETTMPAAAPQIIASQSISEGDSDVPVLVRVDAFPELVQRAPADICCIVDISGSMGAEATIKDSSGNTESNGLSLLDVALHAVRAVIHSIGSKDRLSIVAFDHNADVVFPLTFMNSNAQHDAEKELDKLGVRGGTNLWVGLEQGLDSLCAGRQDRMQHVLLFTDGQDSQRSTTISKLQDHMKLRKTSQAESQLTVSTFGFGYGIDSSLLVQLATIGGGSYAFIPDAGFVGTVFVNAVSNLLVTVTNSAYVDLTPGSGMKILQISGIEADDVETTMLGAEWRVKLGALQLGQTRDLVVYMTPTIIGSLRASGSAYLTAQVGFTLPGNRKALSKVTQALPGSDVDMLQVQRQVHRCDVVDTLGTVLSHNSTSCRLGLCLKPRTEALPMVQQLGEKMQASAFASDSFVAALLEDIQGEVTAALSEDTSLQRWGRHYLPSLMFAHKLQQCNNFKDPGVQMYGGDIFNELRDLADDNFNELPPPKPSIPAPRTYSSGASSHTPVINMAAYNNCYGG